MREHSKNPFGSPGFTAFVIVLGAFGGTIALILAIILLQRLYHCLRTAIAALRLKILTAPYPPGGTEYEEGDVHTICMICVTGFIAGDEVAVLPCGHLFHPRCIKKQLKKQTGPCCALCRAQLL